MLGRARPFLVPLVAGVVVLIVATLVILAHPGQDARLTDFAAARRGAVLEADPGSQNTKVNLKSMGKPVTKVPRAPKSTTRPPVSTGGGGGGLTSGMTAAWAMLDRKTGTLTGTSNASSYLNTTESMIKPWIAADYLRNLAAAGTTPSATVLNEIKLMIIDSNDSMAEKYYRAGGRNSVTQRLVSICKLQKLKIVPYWWSKTEITPQDSIRYGTCLADGRAAGPKWTQWLLDTMTQVRGGVKDQISTTKQGGRWGIIDGLPADIAAHTSIKNGWTSHSDGWHIDCLAVHANFVLVVEMRHPRNLQAGADYCASIARQVITPVLP